MPDTEKIRSLRDSLAVQEKRLQELQQQHAARAKGSDGESHGNSIHDAVAEALQTMRSLVDVLSEAGL